MRNQTSAHVVISTEDDKFTTVAETQIFNEQPEFTMDIKTETKL